MSKEKVLPSQMSFKVLCDFFDAVQQARGKRKALMVRSLLDRTLHRKTQWYATLDDDEVYQIFRLILPYVSALLSHQCKAYIDFYIGQPCMG